MIGSIFLESGSFSNPSKFARRTYSLMNQCGYGAGLACSSLISCHLVSGLITLVMSRFRPSTVIVATSMSSSFIKFLEYPLNALGLNTRRFNAHQEAVTCGICLEDLEPNDLLFEFCHPFHVKCMRPWFMRAHDCPLCRGDLLQYCCVNMNEEEQEKNK